MRDLDKNGDGTIDYQEFVTAAIDKVTALNKNNLVAAFKMIDQDGSGTITRDELQSAFDAHGEKDQELWEEIIR